jgi:gliding motility-associated-like protein
VVSSGALLPVVAFPNDTLLCEGDALEVELLPNLRYQLNGNPIIGTSLAIFQAGVYEITARNDCYETQHTFVVEEDACESSIWIPNAFTPNGDGLNKCFGPVVTNITDREYSFVITNRWGAVVFQSNEPGACWDGVHRGNITRGVHTYRLTYRDSRGKFHERFGQVTVL